MRTTSKYLAGLALAGAVAFTFAGPSQAAHWHHVRHGYHASTRGYDAYGYAPGNASDPANDAYDSVPPGAFGSFGPQTYNYEPFHEDASCGVSPASSQAGACAP